VTLEERLTQVRARIGAAATRAGRDPDAITLVAVTKTFGAHVILEAAELGVTDIGENRAQELREKALAIGDRVRWHFIGPLQTNKVKHVVGVASLLHSIDRSGLASEVDRRARSHHLVQDVLIEVNVAREAAKQGCDPASALALAREVDELPNVAVKGLMTMAPFTEDPEAARPYFRELRELQEVVASEVPSATALSMGMTRDFEVAIEEGATIVRVGEAIFGPRPPAALRA
jgi:pyridoxal phosphate enzyme (YggS family)